MTASLAERCAYLEKTLEEATRRLAESRAAEGGLQSQNSILRAENSALTARLWSALVQQPAELQVTLLMASCIAVTGLLFCYGIPVSLQTHEEDQITSLGQEVSVRVKGCAQTRPGKYAC